MVDFKVVFGTQDGKTYQKEITSPEADILLKKRIGETVSGDSIGFAGYEFVITGGSDKCGFPMRKGIQQPRKRILIGKSVGFSGKDRNKNKQKGLVKRRTVCGELITKIIHQINMKVVKVGKSPLGEVPAEEPQEKSVSKE
ncbi:30S ribosomal protein S6e [Candidatus Woesearchaeota archaeon CG10_big_fil_rev_8_21_14_0_10_36_11]|nr:MAG: 30S ribosomal protein S6e [Candidatus Woesearchaeota archaeon CG10_big_fil_rev_8_21_14_0_10_36_11]